VSEGAFGGPAAVVVPLRFETVVGFVERAGVVQPNAVDDRPPEGRVLPAPAVGIPPRRVPGSRRLHGLVSGVVGHGTITAPQGRESTVRRTSDVRAAFIIAAEHRSHVAFSSDPLTELVVPSGTEAREHDLVTDGDVLVGGRSSVEFGVRGRNVLAGEGARFDGDIEAEGDCRLDMWCDVGGNVLVGEDAYLGERVHVAGELKVAGDLDIGDDVDIEEGFEANGWIVIRNPMPTIVFLFVYLKHLLLLGEDDAAQRLISELVDESEPDEDPLVIPRSATVTDDAWQVSTPARIGAGCRLYGNLRAETIDIGADCNVFGSLRGRGDVTVGTDSRIHGDVTTREGAVTLAEGARVLGDVSCGDLDLGPGAEVDGAIRADGEVTMETGERDLE